MEEELNSRTAKISTFGLYNACVCEGQADAAAAVALMMFVVAIREVEVEEEVLVVMATRKILHQGAESPSSLLGTH